MKILDIIKEEQVLELKAPKFIRLSDPKSLAAYQRLLRMKAAKLTAKTNEFNAVWKKAYPAKSLWIIRMLGIAVAVGDLYVELSYAQEDYDNGKLSQDDLQKYRQWAFGNFILEIGGTLTAALANAMTVTMIAKWIVRIAEAATGTATAGASVVAIIASEAFFQWLSHWLTTSVARDWLANQFVRPFVEHMGQIPEGLWSSLVGYYKAGGAGDKAKDKVEPGQAGQQPNQVDPTKPPPKNPAPNIWKQTPTPTINKKEYMGLSPFEPVANPNPVR